MTRAQDELDARNRAAREEETRQEKAAEKVPKVVKVVPIAGYRIVHSVNGQQRFRSFTSTVSGERIRMEYEITGDAAVDAANEQRALAAFDGHVVRISSEAAAKVAAEQAEKDQERLAKEKEPAAV